MSTFAFLVICIQACLVQNVFAGCGCGAGIAAPYAGNGGCGLGAYNGLAGYDGINGYGLNDVSGYGIGGRGIGYGANYGGYGIGNVGVVGELPVAGTAYVAGNVPILGAVGFGGTACAAGEVSIAGSCGCGCGSPYIY